MEAGVTVDTQPQIVMLVPLAYLIIINKNYYTCSPHFAVKAALKDGLLLRRLSFKFRK